MTDYMHHVPGRLRIRSKLFRREGPSRNILLRRIQQIDGVKSVRLNHKAGSVTVSYDTKSTATENIVNLLEHSHFAAAATDTSSKQRDSRSSAVNGVVNRQITREIGKIAFNVLVSRGVSYSLSSLLGSRA